MIRFSLYDFDRTIFSKDTGVEVLKEIFFQYPQTLQKLPSMIRDCFRAMGKKITQDRLKESLFSPLNYFSEEEWQIFIQRFWKNHHHQLFPLVVEQIKKDKDEGYIVGVITASIDEMVKPIFNYLPIDFLIGTEIKTINSQLTSQIIGENCKKQAKVTRLYDYINRHYPQQEYEFSKMYSDSLHDLPLLKLSKEPYAVNKYGEINAGFPLPNRNL